MRGQHISTSDSIALTAPRSNRRDQYLDVLRAVAIGMVMLRHAWPDLFPAGGIVGVTLFFALSGNLITRVLDRDLRGFGRPRFARFYMHRILRLYPALILVVVTYVIVTVLTDPGQSRWHVAATAAVALTYLSDFPTIFSMSGPLGHLWTLAIEEQYYLVWPILLWIASRFTKRLGFVALAFAVILTAICIVTLFGSSSPSAIYMWPTTWASTIAIGCASYFWRDRIRRFIGRAASLVALVALLVLFALLFFPDAKSSYLPYLVGPTLVALCAVAIINWATEESRSEVRVPILKPLRWLGMISYGVYLWNFPITSWWGDTEWSQIPFFGPLAEIPLSIIAAAISWYTVEAVGRRLRVSFDASVARRAAAKVDAEPVPVPERA